MPDTTPDENSWVLTASHCLTMDVQMAAPTRMKSAAMIDEAVEIKNSSAFFAIPLSEMLECGACEDHRLLREQCNSCKYRPEEDEVVCDASIVTQVARVSEGCTRKQGGGVLCVVLEHVRRDCGIRLETVCNGVICACSGRAVNECAIGIKAELVELSQPVLLAEW